MPDTVCVGCKLPMGLHLDLPGKRVTLRGTAVLHGEPPAIVSGGYALTNDVDKDFMDEWLLRYAKLDIVEKQIVYVMPKPVEARAKSKELIDVKTGLEPIPPDKPGPGLEPIGTKWS
jgi:hypothetical protein